MELKIQNVSMTYPSGKQALKGLDLDLKSPSLIGLLGPNGAGKSTLMKLLVAALMPTEGSILVDGAPLNKVEGKLKASLGYEQICAPIESRSSHAYFWGEVQNSNDFFFHHCCSSNYLSERILRCGAAGV